MGWRFAGLGRVFRAGVAVVVVAALTPACGRGGATNAGDVEVVATTTVLGDVVGEIVACAGGRSRTLMPIGADPHDFAPSSADVTRMVKADLVVANGLGLEEGLADALANAESDGARIFEVAAKLDPVPFSSQDDHGGGQPGNGDQRSSPGPGDVKHEPHQHADGSADPHFWHDVARMAKAARIVAAELGKLTKDPATFERCGAKTAEALEAVDTQVRQILGAVPPQRRVLVTDHHAFGYLAQAYGFEIAGVVIPGGSTLASPGSAEVAGLIKVIRQARVPAIFSNVAVSSDLVATVAREAGAQIRVVPLFVGSLGERGSGAESYQGMVRTNAKRIADALRG